MRTPSVPGSGSIVECSLGAHPSCAGPPRAVVAREAARPRERPSRLLEEGYDIPTVNALLGYRDVRTTMIHTHVLNRGRSGVGSPLDGLVAGDGARAPRLPGGVAHYPVDARSLTRWEGTRGGRGKGGK